MEGGRNILIKLSKARELAENIIDKKKKIPKCSGLRNWISEGLLTSYETIKEGGRGKGRIGLYDDSLPIQIATVATLKQKYKLNEIAKVKKLVIDQLMEGKTRQEIFGSEPIKEINSKVNKMTNTKPQIPNELEKSLEALDTINLIQQYIDAYKSYEILMKVKEGKVNNDN